MSAMIPMALFGLEVPCGDVAIPALSGIPSAFRITMAAIDPSAESEDPSAAPRATLKVIRQALVDYDSEDDDEDDFDISEMEAMLAEQNEDDDDDEEDSDDEDINGGPSDPSRSKKAKKAAAQKAIMEMLENGDDDEDDMDVDEAPKSKKSAKALGKMPASESDEDEDDEDSDDEDGEVEEFVICTLDPVKNYQQPLDITIGENERVFFKVSGTHSIYLTGNYVEPTHDHEHGENGMYDPDSDEEDDYDLEPGSDEEIDYDEEDELDDIEDPRITEVEDEEEAPKLVKTEKADKKGKNKRAAEDEPASIDELIAKAETNGDKPLSKKQLKKLKKNDGTATETKTEEPSSAKSDKKVQFAKQLEQGPTPTKADAKTEKTEKKKDAAPAGVRVVQGVTIDDKKLGTGPAAKAGDKLGMRYIGKLEKDGKVFDSNKKGKPFSFKLGVGEVIKGWDIGIAGMTAGGERRITVPAHLGYGKSGSGPIPGNATLIFDVKLLSVSKK